MKILVVGASGATGKLLVRQLLDAGHEVCIVVRSKDSLPDALVEHPSLDIRVETLLNLSDDQMNELVNGCDGIASCLGHNLTFKGIYGHPRRLVTDAVRRLCKAIKSNTPAAPVRFVLMNTTGNRNRDLEEPISMAQRIIIALLRVLLPPHPDNEQAAEYLRTGIGQHDPDIQWAVVRPDGLIDNHSTTPYEEHPSPIRSAIFDAGKSSRINVAHFMKRLLTEKEAWEKWKGQMPVIYNQDSHWFLLETNFPIMIPVTITV